MFSSTSSEFREKLQNSNTSFNVHHFGIDLDNWKKFNIGNFYKIVSLSIDDEKNYVVSAMEGIQYPFYEVQFHPEKPTYNQSPLGGMHRD